MKTGIDLSDHYIEFSEYYDVVAEYRGHYEAQFNSIIHLMKRINISKSKRILDAAAGTGKTGEKLFNSGFQNLLLNDKSSFMLNSSRVPHIRITNYDWIELQTEFGNNSFEVVLIIGNSLSHTKNVEEVFLNVFKILKPGGHFIFDIRNWDINSEGRVKGNREKRLIYANDLEKLTIEDSATLDNNIQIVTYEVTEQNKLYESFQLEYHFLSDTESIKMLIRAGFSESEVKMFDYSHMNYGYKFIVVKK